MTLTDLYIRDKSSGAVRRIGENQHDMLFITNNGVLEYHNLQNGDGCRLGEDNSGCGYDFVSNVDEHGYNCDPRIPTGCKGSICPDCGWM